MTLHSQELLQKLAAGDIAARDLAGLDRRDIDALRALAQSQSAVGRYQDAVVLYEALFALEPDVPEYLFFRAEALAHTASPEHAVDAVDAFLDVEGVLPADLRARALLLRAQLTQKSDPKAAEQALIYLQLLAEQSDEAKAVLAGVA